MPEGCFMYDGEDGDQDKTGNANKPYLVFYKLALVLKSYDRF